MRSGTLYKDDNLELLKDCFNFAIKYVNNDEGLIVFSTKEGYVISAYDLESKYFIHEYEGQIIITDDKLFSNVYVKCNKVNIPGRTSYFLHFISTKNDYDNKLSFLKNISSMIQGNFKISKKHSEYGDMVLRALDNVNDAISYCDKNEYVRYANKACFEILKTNKEELFGKSLREMTTGNPMLVKVLKDKKSIIDVEYFLKYRGKGFRFINSGYPVYSDEGELVGAIDIFRTIERSRRLANNIAGYEAFFTFDDVIGENRKTIELVNLAKIFSKTDETVIILGESGTGKEIIAQSIHNYSNRREGPFIALNCANFPNDIIDSELFGYDDGAFTGAKKGGKQGKFELASGGTLFLDEIGEMQIHLQAKLLRVLETKYITRIGGNNQIKVDVRIIGATNRNLEQLVDEGKFRKDLYYRLKVLCIETSPLRERGNDVIVLAEHFIKKLSDKLGNEKVIITDKAKDVLLKYNWPGNIRELENSISRALFICEENNITEKTLFKAGVKESKYHEIIKRDRIKINREILIDMMCQMNGNKKRIAEKLGISRPTLYKMLKKYDIN